MNGSPATRSSVTGVILAGGRAQRMGGRDKGLLPVAGKPMIARVIARLKPQVASLVINANRSQEAYAAYGHPVVPDLLEGYCGPLAGMASAMRAAPTAYILSVPCDSPFVPVDLLQRLGRALEEDAAEIAVAHNGARMQPVFALVACGLLPSLLGFLEAGERKIDRWYATRRTAVADFSDQPEAFLNLNTPEDIEAVEARLRAVETC